VAIINSLRLWLLLLLPCIAVAQTPLLGSPVTDNIPPISFQSEGAISNIMLGSITASSSVDSNNTNSATNQIVGAQYFLAPSLTIQNTHSHLTWNVSYSPGVRVYVPSSSQLNQFSQLFGGTLLADLTKRLTIGLRQDYLRTTDPFQQPGNAMLQPGIGLFDQTPIPALPNIRYTTLFSQISARYHFTKYISFGLSGDIAQSHYDEINTSTNSLIDTRETSGSAFVSHQFSPRQAVGIQYVYLNMKFPPGDSFTASNGILLFDQIAVNPHMSFSIFGGLERARIRNEEVIDLDVFGVVVPVQIPISNVTWSPAGGTSFYWDGSRLGVEASFVRRVSDGGGLLGSVEMNYGSLQLKEKLARRWIASLEGQMVREALLAGAANGNINTVDVGAGIDRDLAQNTRVRLSYQRLRGSGQYISAGFDHNRITLSVQQNFNLPLGRR
jgi:hypothetical protein